MSGPDEVKPVKLAIVAPVHNRRELTLQCLQSLARIDRTGLEVEIFIVDDGCTDGTREALEERFPQVHIVHGTGELWYTAGTNLGIVAALKHKPDYVLCINDDSIFDERSVSRMIDLAKLQPRSVVGALLLLWDTPHRVFQVAPVWNTWKGGWQHWYQQTVWTVPNMPWEVDAIVGNCILYPAAVFEECGFMNPSISAQYGDAEFTTRLRKCGWRLLIEPRARVFCQPNYEHTSVTSQPIRKQIDLLFRKKSSALSVSHQFRQSFYTAPNKLAGLAAFFAFYGRVAKRKLVGRTGKNVPEPDLADHFSANVIKE
ncbi:MAG TPA: glycosyltransferase family 2 protein [Pyrinomonadaceae bacterium]|nr:glycosyltransferase family 2 protein [Pyrinomonadaceae bacterium]